MISAAETKFKVLRALSKSRKIIPKDMEAEKKINLRNKFKVRTNAKNKGIKNAKS